MNNISKTVCVLIALVALNGCGGKYSDLEASAKPIVSQIIKENFGSEATACKSVKVTEKVSDDFYKATAYLENGESVKITIKKTENNYIYVNIVE